MKTREKPYEVFCRERRIREERLEDILLSLLSSYECMVEQCISLLPETKRQEFQDGYDGLTLNCEFYRKQIRGGQRIIGPPSFLHFERARDFVAHAIEHYNRSITLHWFTDWLDDLHERMWDTSRRSTITLDEMRVVLNFFTENAWKSEDIAVQEARALFERLGHIPPQGD